MVKMCDEKVLNWCGRITLLLSICGILCVMMIQIWSYYYSLVTQMDEMILESPQVHGVLDMCEGVVNRAWNINDCVRGVCVVDNIQQNLFIDVRGNANVSVNVTSLIIEPPLACVRIMLWILPW